MFQRRQMCFILMMIVTANLSAIATTATAVEVAFPDANLEARVRTELRMPTEPITDSDMRTLESFQAGGYGIVDLQGLEYGTNLDKLSLAYNAIVEISPVAGLTNLTELELGVNRIINISPVAGLTSLAKLELDRNQITDLSPVTGLSNLNLLDLDTNEISDISAVAGLTKLNILYLHDNHINDISPVAGLTNLRILYLYNNQISDVSAVAGLTNLTTLTLHYNPITDISSMAGLTNLRYLRLDRTQVTDVSPLAGLAKLNHLSLDYNHIETLDLSGANLPSLSSFNIRFNPLKHAILADATLSQTSFNALMDGPNADGSGISELGGVLSLDMSGVDFAPIANLSAMYSARDLETLLLEGATNLDGSKVVRLTRELDSLNWLDVTGTWDGFDAASQNSLRTWGDTPGHTLVVPEPGSIVLLVCGMLVLPACGIRRLFGRSRLCVFLAVAAFVVVSRCEAGVTAFSTPYTFSGQETLIDFERLAVGYSEEVHSVSGVRFSLLAMDTLKDTGLAPEKAGAPHSTYAREFPPYDGWSFLNTVNLQKPFDNDLQIEFPEPVNRVAAEIRSGPSGKYLDDLTFELYRGDAPIGSLTPEIRGLGDFFFYGVESTEPFDRWVIRQRPDTRLCLENLRFETVPEPTTLILLGIAVAGLLVNGRGRHRI